MIHFHSLIIIYSFVEADEAAAAERIRVDKERKARQARARQRIEDDDEEDESENENADEGRNGFVDSTVSFAKCLMFSTLC